MRTDPAMRLLRLLLVSSLSGGTGVAWGWQADWDLDTEMAVLEAPVRRPIILPFGDGRQRGAPRSPGWTYYKQQPPGAQGDFRDLPPGGGGLPGGGPTFAPGGSGGNGGGDTGVAPVGGGGGNNVGNDLDNGNNPPNQPPGPQLPPPEIEGPEIPTDPLPPINPPPVDLI